MSFVDPGVRRHDVIGVHTFACWNVQMQAAWRIQVYVEKALAMVKAHVMCGLQLNLHSIIF
jgi:hypothetical protein